VDNQPGQWSAQDQRTRLSLKVDDVELSSGDRLMLTGGDTVSLVVGVR
jgi:hypothetical protein